MHVLLLLFKELATSRWLSVLGLGSYLMLCISQLPLLAALMVWFFWSSPNFCVVYHHWTEQRDKSVVTSVYLSIFICLSPPPKTTLGNNFGWWKGASCLCFWPMRTVWWFDCHYLCCETKRKAQGRVMKGCTSRWREASTSSIYDLGNAC